MGGGICFPEVGFDFYDAGSATRRARLSYQDLPQEFAGYAAGIAAEESTIERTQWSDWRRGSRFEHAEES
jgi:hypothetical protein